MSDLPPLESDDHQRDPYSRPLAPTWNGLHAGEGGRFVPTNRAVREPYKAPRAERIIEITCDRSLIATVFPRTRPSREWRLLLMDEESPLHPPQGGRWPRERSPYALDVPFSCVCGRMHVLDREKVAEAAERLMPRRAPAPARRVDFRSVARVVWDGPTSTP